MSTLFTLVRRGDIASETTWQLRASGNSECAPFKTGATAWDFGLRNLESSESGHVRVSLNRAQQGRQSPHDAESHDRNHTGQDAEGYLMPEVSE